DHEAEALARFDELLTGPVAVRPVRRSVRPNAATAHVARLDAAVASRDADAFHALFADAYEGVEYTTGATFDRDGALSMGRSLLRSQDPTCRNEPLAALGDRLALCRRLVSASGVAGRTFDVGAYEREEITLIEVDGQGRERRAEVFAADRLGDAIARLYERYADSLPDGPARARAAATARSVAQWLLGPHNAESYAPTLAPDIESVDRRILATWSAHGPAAVVRHTRSLLDLIAAYTARHDDIRAVRSDALIVRRTPSGIDRAGGGIWERPYLGLLVFGADGLVSRWEQFEVGDAAGALARFDELTADAT